MGKRVTPSSSWTELEQGTRRGLQLPAGAGDGDGSRPGYAIAAGSAATATSRSALTSPRCGRIPWLEATALVLCDVLWHDGSPVEPSPRQVLRAQVERAEALGFSPMLGSELEFFLFKESYEEAREKHYRDLTPSVPYILDYHVLATSYDEPLIREIRNGMEGAGHPVESSKGEAGPGQHEINFRYADAVRDGRRPRRLQERGQGDRAPARLLGDLHGEARPHAGRLLVPHPLDLWRGDEAPSRASPTSSGSSSPGGSPAHASSRSSSRRRSTRTSATRPASWAPTTLAWGHDNRTCGFRVVGHGAALRVETRIPGADVNPYLAFAALIAAGLHGIEHGARAAGGIRGQRVRVRRRALPVHAPRGDRRAGDGHDGARRARRRRGRPLPELRAHGAGALRPDRHVLRARAAVRARMTLTVVNPATEKPIAELEQAGRRGDRRGRRAREGRLPRLACRRARRPRAPAAALAMLVEEHGRSSRRSSRRTSASRSRAPAARSAWSPQVFHFYAGAVDKHHGETIPVAGGVDRDLPRAARRRRADRPLELPAQHRELEARPGARLRQHRRAQAGRADAALGASARRARARGRHPRGRPQRPRRAGLGRRAAAGRAPRTWRRSASPARPRSAAR